MRDAEGCILRWFVLQTDIDERKRNEAALTSAFEELAKSEAELRTIIDAIPQLIVSLRADGTFLSANQAVLDYTGPTKEKMRTESFGDVFHPEDTERLRDQRDLAISRGVPFEYNDECAARTVSIGRSAFRTTRCENSSDGMQRELTSTIGSGLRMPCGRANTSSVRWSTVFRG